MAEIAGHSGERGPPAAPQRLTASHDLSRFDSGSDALNGWLKDHALASEGQSARTYVVCDNTIVIGYYCIATGSVERRALPSRLKRQQGLPNQTPVAIIGRLARDVRWRGSGLGADLLQDALSRIVAAAEIIGVRCVVVHAIDDEAARFWKANEFIEYPENSRTFYIPLETILTAL